MELVLFLQLLCSWGYKCEYVSMSRICNDTRAADHVAPGLLAPVFAYCKRSKAGSEKGRKTAGEKPAVPSVRRHQVNLIQDQIRNRGMKSAKQINSRQYRHCVAHRQTVTASLLVVQKFCAIQSTTGFQLNLRYNLLLDFRAWLVPSDFANKSVQIYMNPRISVTYSIMIVQQFATKKSILKMS